MTLLIKMKMGGAQRRRRLGGGRESLLINLTEGRKALHRVHTSIPVNSDFSPSKSATAFTSPSILDDQRGLDWGICRPNIRKHTLCRKWIESPRWLR